MFFKFEHTKNSRLGIHEDLHCNIIFIFLIEIYKKKIRKTLVEIKKYNK